MTDIVHDQHELDPLGDAEELSAENRLHNYARVGSSRPSALLYTYGPGAILDLPNFTVMPAGLDDWERIYARRPYVPTISAPRLLTAVQTLLDPGVVELRAFPFDADAGRSDAGPQLGVPARVFPQWLRCTGCDLLALPPAFTYRNTHPYRPDLARFEHESCPGRPTRDGIPRRPGKRVRVVPARYLLACENGHLDEFPYSWWVHEGQRCPATASDATKLYMHEHAGARGASAQLECALCGATRQMSEAQGEAGASKLPGCRARLPHLGGYVPDGCAAAPRLMVVGASNLWFPASQSIVVMPTLDPGEVDAERVTLVRSVEQVASQLPGLAEQPALARAMLTMLPAVADALGLATLSDADLHELLSKATRAEHTEEDIAAQRQSWDPTDLLVPEWRYLQIDPKVPLDAHEGSGLTLSPRTTEGLPDQVQRVLAVDRLRKVNALVGFTRIDDFDRVNDPAGRLVPLSRRRPRWTIATEDRGEGFFLQLREDAVADWETRAGASELWAEHRAAHRRNFERRFSETAKWVNPADRLPPPRYWLVHTLAHVLIRELALSSGYGAASITERLYAWTRTPQREPAAGLLIITTASDSDGTLGGLVALSEPAKLSSILASGLERAMRCSSDPVCTCRTPHAPEDFLHGAACHCCTFASETSCERANRFLDRRFLVDLPGYAGLGFFASRYDR